MKSGKPFQRGVSVIRPGNKWHFRKVPHECGDLFNRRVSTTAAPFTLRFQDTGRYDGAASKNKDCPQIIWSSGQHPQRSEVCFGSGDVFGLKFWQSWNYFPVSSGGGNAIRKYCFYSSLTKGDYLQNEFIGST